MTRNPAVTPSIQDVPSNLSVPRFLLDGYCHTTRPERPKAIPCLIDDTTGEKVFIEEVCIHVAYALYYLTSLL